VAKPFGLDIDPDQARDVGEFMGVGLQAQLAEIVHSYVHLTGRDRPGEDTLRVPLGTKNANIEEEEHDVPKPDLSMMQALFTLAPGLQPTVSPALYKLGSGLTIAEVENNTPPPRKPATPAALMPPPSIVPAATGQGSVSPKKAAQAIQAAAGQGRVDTVSNMLAETGLLKIDKGGHEHGADGPKKEKKHTLHWKYEDPATLLKDVLG
jgi:transcriptional coactivator HFI1/ADA1